VAAEVLPAPASELPAMPAIPGSANDEVARKSRVAQQAAETRRAKTAQLAQERARASDEAQRLQRAQEQQQLQQRQQQVEVEQARQQQLLAERERAAAAERAQTEVTLHAAAPRRDVQALCARSAGGFIGEQFCHTRECRKAEHQADALCVRLREIDLARLQRGADH
jgi:hypothetical protein